MNKRLRVYLLLLRITIGPVLIIAVMALAVLGLFILKHEFYLKVISKGITVEMDTY